MRILVVKLSSLGDLVHALPAVACVQEAYPDAVFDWVTQPEYVGLVGCIERIERVIPFPRKNFARGFGAFRRELRREAYDLVLDFQGLWKSGIATRSARLAPGGRRIGPSFAREGSRLLFGDCAKPGPADRHAVQRCLDTPRHLDLTTGPIRFPFNPPEVDKPAGDIPIGILPKSRWLAKNWPMEYLAVFCRRLLEREGVHLHLLGGPADEDVCEAMQLELGPERVSNHAGKTSIPQLLGTIAQLRMLVGNDSGPLHLGAAMGVPLLAFYGPTDPKKTGPWIMDGKRAEVLEAPRDGSSYKGEDDHVIRQISVDEAHAAALRLLA